MWKGELILKEGSTNDGTTIPEGEGRPKLCQRLGLETSRRPTVEMTSSNLDRCGP